MKDKEKNVKMKLYQSEIDKRERKIVDLEFNWSNLKAQYQELNKTSKHRIKGLEEKNATLKCKIKEFQIRRIGTQPQLKSVTITSPNNKNQKAQNGEGEDFDKLVNAELMNNAIPKNMDKGTTKVLSIYIYIYI